MVYYEAMASNDSFMHIVNLFELLTNTSRPLTYEEIVQALPSLPTGTAAKRQAFERAKSSLKSLGFPIRVVDSPTGKGQGYLIDRKDVALDLALSREEEAALAFALSSIGSITRENSVILRKLGLTESSSFLRVLSQQSVDDSFTVLFDAISTKTPVEFCYGRDRRRRIVSPYGLLQRWGRWYLAAAETKDERVKSFRLDRIEGSITLGDQTHYITRPDDFDIDSLLTKDPWSIKVSDSDTVVVGYQGDKVELDWFFEDRSEVPIDDKELLSSVSESWTLRAVVVSNWDGFLSDVMSLGTDVRIVAPQRAIQLATSWLEGMITASRKEIDAVITEPVSGARYDEVKQRRANVSSQKAIRRFELLSEILPYLGRVRSTTISDTVERFKVSQKELIEVLEFAATCGLPPYTPDQLYEIIVDPEEDLIEVRLDTPLAQPRRLSLAEALVVLVAVRTLIVADNRQSQPLLSALAKLELAVSGLNVDDEDIFVKVENPSFRDEMEAAIEAEATVSIRYEDKDERVVAPVLLFVYEGKWYLRALDLKSNSVRHFQLNKVSGLRILKKTQPRIDAASAKDFDVTDPFMLKEKAVEVRGWVSGFGLRVLDTYLGSYLSVLEDHGDISLVQIPSSSTYWLSSLLLRLGPHFVFSDPSASGRELQREVASKVLALYSA